ncbi:MAG: cobalamin-dependent protein [Rhodothermales bacterium]
MTDSSVSTRVASKLLSVHESSIKRWCNAGELEYWTTPGGHRRIPISKLVSFANDRGLEGEILGFGDSAERVWVGLEGAKRDESYFVLSKLVFEWINLGRIELVENLVPFLVNQGLALGSVFDKVLGSAMGQVGASYVAQEISVGDEHRLTNLIRDALLEIRQLLSVDETDPGSSDRRTAVVGCLRGEIHEIGALMIRLLLLNAGWNVIYLGQDVPTEEFHAQALKHDAELICISLAPPRGTPEAVDAVNLLGSLFGNTDDIRLAVGGSALKNETLKIDNKSFSEVRFFNGAVPFENWLVSRSS